MLPNSGIYEIVNKVNGHGYIGSAVDTRGRRNSHWKDARQGKHHSKYFQRAWDKYGEDAFEFKVLLRCDRDMLLFYEQLCMDNLNSEYNMCRIAGSCLGIHPSEATKQKIGKANRGRFHSLETRNKMSMSHTGLLHTEEEKAKISEGNKGKVLSEEHRRKIGINMKRINTGRKFSSEHKRKIGLARKKAWTPEMKLLLSNKLKKFTDEEEAEIYKITQSKEYSKVAVGRIYGVSDETIRAIEKRVIKRIEVEDGGEDGSQE